MDKSALRGLLLPIALLCASFAPGAGADIGPLGDVVDTGFSDGWDARVDSGTYWLENRQEKGAIRYYYTPYDSGDDGAREIRVKVKIESDDPQARAGLIYGFDSSTRNYYLILLGPNGQMEVVQRDSSGFNLRMSNSSGANAGDFNEIAVREKGNELSLTVNGRDVGGFGNETTGKGAVGIVAVGTGRFGFTGYREQTASRSEPGSAGRKNSQSGASAIPRQGDEKHVVRDEFGFEQPMDALTLTLPQGWDVRGAVQWYGMPNCAMDLSMPKFHFVATAPDGKQWVEYVPGGVWSWSSNFDVMPQMAQSGLAGCKARRITDIQTFVSEYIPAIRPNARIESSRPRPDQASAALSDLVQAMQKQDPNIRLRPEAMEVRISYSANGGTVHELLIPVVLFMDQRTVDFQGGMNAVLTQAIAMGTIMTATVDGEADEDLLEFIGSHMDANPAYQARLDRHYQERTQLMAQATARQLAANRAYRASLRNSSSSSSSVAATNSEILDIQMDGYQNRERIRDAGHARSVDMIHERKPWQNASGMTIYMPQEYQRAYQLPNDVYAGTNDAFFNPVDGTQMTPARY